MAFGIAVGAHSGRFREERLLEAPEEFEITNVAAAPTVFRRINDSGIVGNYRC